MIFTDIPLSFKCETIPIKLFHSFKKNAIWVQVGGSSGKAFSAVLTITVDMETISRFITPFLSPHPAPILAILERQYRYISQAQIGSIVFDVLCPFIVLWFTQRTVTRTVFILPRDFLYMESITE
jgi:hypothetical protein